MAQITVVDTPIALREAGRRGPVVICLHCSSSHSGQYKALMADLEQRYRLVAPDLHGYGRSGPLPQDGQPWFVHDRAVVGSLLDRFPGETVHLVGHSMGAATAFFAAREWPDRIASMTLIEPVLFGLLSEAGLDSAKEGFRISSDVHGYLRLQMPELAAQSFVDFWSGQGAWNRLPTETRAYITDTAARVADDWSGVLADLPDRARLADCAAFTMPVQLLRGTKTRQSTGQISDLLAGAMPWAELHDIQGADHMGPVAYPELYNPLIVRFLDRHTQINQGEDHV